MISFFLPRQKEIFMKDIFPSLYTWHHNGEGTFPLSPKLKLFDQGDPELTHFVGS